MTLHVNVVLCLCKNELTDKTISSRPSLEELRYLTNQSSSTYYDFAVI